VRHGRSEDTDKPRQQREWFEVTAQTRDGGPTAKILFEVTARRENGEGWDEATMCDV